MSKPRATIPEPYADVMSLHSSVKAMKELVEVLAGQRGTRGSGAVTFDALDEAMGSAKVKVSGDTMTGPLVVTGNITATANVQANGGELRAQASASGANTHVHFLNSDGTHRGWCYCDNGGGVHLQNTAGNELQISSSGWVYGGVGYTTRTAGNGSYGSNFFNFYWTGSGLNVYVDNSYMGVMAYQSDYRIKKDVQDLGSTWDAVKALRPVTFSFTDYGELFKGDDQLRWGFIAHELQETLIDDAATGHKDDPDMIQSPNPWTIIAALTKTVQELQARVEALEAHG